MKRLTWDLEWKQGGFGRSAAHDVGTKSSRWAVFGVACMSPPFHTQSVVERSGATPLGRA
eukprot:scaffold967_cov321-Pavlova_lutheri.AAC.24